MTIERSVNKKIVIDAIRSKKVKKVDIISNNGMGKDKLVITGHNELLTEIVEGFEDDNKGELE